MSTAAAEVNTGHDVHHDEHHDHEQSFISKYIFTTDHKMIGKQFLVTGILWGLIGVGMSVIFRLQLGFPKHVDTAVFQ